MIRGSLSFGLWFLFGLLPAAFFAASFGWLSVWASAFSLLLLPQMLGSLQAGTMLARTNPTDLSLPFNWLAALIWTCIAFAIFSVPLMLFEPYLESPISELFPYVLRAAFASFLVNFVVLRFGHKLELGAQRSREARKFE